MRSLLAEKKNKLKTDFCDLITSCRTILAKLVVYTYISDMKIEEELKTTNFLSEHQKLHLNLMVSASRVKSRINEKLKKFGLVSEQYNVLRILRGSHPNPMCIRDIHSRMIEKSSNTGRIVEKLLRKNYLVRTESPEDRRFYSINLTEKGLDLLKKVDADIVFDKLINPDLSEEEIKSLNSLLEKLRD